MIVHEKHSFTETIADSGKAWEDCFRKPGEIANHTRPPLWELLASAAENISDATKRTVCR